MQRNMQWFLGSAALLFLAACGKPPAAAELDGPAGPGPTEATEAALVARGEYIAVTSGCNDCHSPGYPESGGTTPRDTWLVGTPLGWNGPWGTTYAANLRLKAQDMDEAAGLDYTATLHTRPPMPDFAVRAMAEDDRRALFHFIRSLGAAGNAAPAYLPPGETPPVPYVEWHLPPPAPAAG